MDKEHEKILEWLNMRIAFENYSEELAETESCSRCKEIKRLLLEELAYSETKSGKLESEFGKVRKM